MYHLFKEVHINDDIYCSELTDLVLFKFGTYLEVFDSTIDETLWNIDFGYSFTQKFNDPQCIKDNNTVNDEYMINIPIGPPVYAMYR